MSSYRSVAASVAHQKEKHPEAFCPVKRCLWRTGPTGGGYCPRHKYLAPADSRPRVPFQLPDGREVPIIFDHGDVIPWTTTFQLASGEVVEARRLAAWSAAETDGGAA